MQNTTSTETKSWGRVWARPSEYLIKLRKGQVVCHGPGLSVFLWPGQTCAILPMSIQRTSFVADQITSEKVGMEVTGVAVYRIADPLLAFRMLDFTGDSAGADTLALTLREMFIGAVRRLVASMTVEQCLTRRKESIAQELLQEIQPVVSGEGRADDSTDKGWGVVIDTIEIQDVRILSEAVFADLQAPYRTRLRLEAKRSQVQQEELIHLRKVESDRKRLEADQELHRRQAELKRQRAEEEEALKRLRQQQQAELAKAETVARLACEELEAAGAARVIQETLEGDRLRGELNASLRRQEREVDNLFSQQRIRYEFVAHALPAMAKAIGDSLGPVHLTHFEGGQGSGQGLAHAVTQVLSAARAAGLDLQTLIGASSLREDKEE